MTKGASIGSKLLVELLGTFILTFIGAGSIIATGGSQLVVIALAHGLALAIAITIAFNISGGHINPAVTIGMLVARRISARNALSYIIAQVLGATIAGFILVLLYPVALGAAVHYGTPTLASGISVLNGIAMEAVITFILVLTVFGTCVDERAPKIAGFGVGLVLAGLIMAAGPFTGAAANPARAIGPAIASMFFTNWYVYWIGPILGGIIAALVYEYGVLRKK